MKDVKKTFSKGEKVIADQVADEILTVTEERENRRYFILILIFLSCLIFLVSSLSFAIFDSYFNGEKTNVIDVGIDISVDNSKKPVKPVKPESVLFSFNEGSNYINMVNVFPTSDAVGKVLSGDKEYFDFNVSSKFGNKNKGEMVYEISIVPVSGNTINDKDVRVYLTENGKGVSVMNNKVNTFADLPDSSYNKNGKVVYKKVVKKDLVVDYVFRMWLSSDADVTDVSQKFACKIVVNAYYK